MRSRDKVRLMHKWVFWVAGGKLRTRLIHRWVLWGAGCHECYTLTLLWAVPWPQLFIIYLQTNKLETDVGGCASAAISTGCSSRGRATCIVAHHHSQLQFQVTWSPGKNIKITVPCERFQMPTSAGFHSHGISIIQTHLWKQKAEEGAAVAGRYEKERLQRNGEKW